MKQLLIANPVECLGVIQIGDRAFFFVFYALYDGANRMKVALNCSALYSTSVRVTTEFQQLTANNPSKSWPKSLTLFWACNCLNPTKLFLLNSMIGSRRDPYRSQLLNTTYKILTNRSTVQVINSWRLATADLLQYLVNPHSQSLE